MAKNSFLAEVTFKKHKWKRFSEIRLWNDNPVFVDPDRSKRKVLSRVVQLVQM